MSEETSSPSSHLEDDNSAVGLRNPQEAEDSAAESKPANDVVPVVDEKVPRTMFLFGSPIFSAYEVGESSSSRVNAVDEKPPRGKMMKLPARPKPRGPVPPPSYGDGRKTLCGLGVENPTWILDKFLSVSDVSGGQSRLLLTGKRVMQTPLLGMMRPREIELVNDKMEGLPVTAIDDSGREFEMTFKYLDCNGSYRLIGQWGTFVRVNHLRAGDKIQIWAFRCCRRTNDEEVDGLRLALLDSPTADEFDGADALLLLLNTSP